MASDSSVSASRSIVRLPSVSAVVPRMKRHVDREGLVEQVLLAVDRHQSHQVLGGALVDAAAAVARVDEGVQADARQDAPACRRRCRGTGARSRPAAGSRPRCWLSTASFCSAGTSPQWPPITRAHQAFVAEVVEAARPCRRPARRRRPASGRAALRSARKRCSSATARFSAKPMPTKPLLATVSPSRTSATASAALTTLPLPPARSPSMRS